MKDTVRMLIDKNKEKKKIEAIEATKAQKVAKSLKAPNASILKAAAKT